MALYANPEKMITRWDNNISIGQEFESNFGFYLKQLILKKGIKQEVTMHSRTDMDTGQGTDVSISSRTKNQVVEDIRIDPTLYISDKNFMPYIADSNIFIARSYKLWFGIRLGHYEPVLDIGGKPRRKNNGEVLYRYKPFDRPVVVVGTNMEPEDYNFYKDKIEEDLEEKMEAILDYAYDCLEDYKTMDLEVRIDLMNTPLKKNSNYRPPNGRLGAYYEQVAEWREKNVYNQGHGDKGAKEDQTHDEDYLSIN